MGIELDQPDTESQLFASAAADSTVTQKISAPPPACLQTSGTIHSITSPATPPVQLQAPPPNIPQAVSPLPVGAPGTSYFDLLKVRQPIAV